MRSSCSTAPGRRCGPTCRTCSNGRAPTASRRGTGGGPWPRRAARAAHHRRAALGEWDAVIVDCAPTAETVRLLALPSTLRTYLDRVLPAHRRLARSVAPVLRRATSMPPAPAGVLDSVLELTDELGRLHSARGPAGRLDPARDHARVDGGVGDPAGLVLPGALRFQRRFGPGEPRRAGRHDRPLARPPPPGPAAPSRHHRAALRRPRPGSGADPSRRGDGHRRAALVRRRDLRRPRSPGLAGPTPATDSGPTARSPGTSSPSRSPVPKAARCVSLARGR